MNINKPLNREKSRAGTSSPERASYRATLKQTIRILTVLLVMLITGSAEAWAQTKSIKYLDYVGGSAVFAEATTNAKPITSSNAVISGPCYVEGNVTFNRGLALAGDTEIILCDGATLEISPNSGDGIEFNCKNLTIYAQSSGSHAGKLTINYRYDGFDGDGNVTINGGNISVISTSGDGIDCHDFTLNGGKVDIAASSWGMIGIWAFGDVTINGGSLSVTSGGYGIYTDDGHDVTINGGKVSVTDGSTGIESGGAINLGWTNAEDYIEVNKYNKGVSTANGKDFYIDGTGTLGGGALVDHENVDGKRLTPKTDASIYTVSLGSGITGGTVEVNKAKAFAGERLAINVTPDAGFYLASLTCSDGTNDYPITQQANDYDITMPAHDVTVTATFASLSMNLMSNLGTKATVTFFDGGTTAAPNASSFNPANYPDANAITSIDNRDGKDHYIIAHIVPAADYWTDISQLQAYETMPYTSVTARKRESASGSDIGFDLFNTLTLLKKDEYNAGTTAAPDMKPRCDGAGWYYYTLPKEHTIDAKYTASTIDGFMIKKFDFSSDNETNVSQSGKVISIKNGEGWTAELELDDIDFPFTGENIGPTFASITIKKDSETDPAFILTDQTDITIAQQLKTPLKNSKMIGSGVPLSSNAKDDYTWFRLTNFFSEEDPYSLVMNSTYSIIVPFNGSGTVGDPWKINNAEDLVMLGKCVNIGNYPFEVEYLVQTADIDMSGTSGFTPIGLIDPSDAHTSFAGNYNGRYDDGTGAKDHFISGITYTNSTAPSYDGAYSCMGLFGEVGNTDKAGTIQNLTLKDCSFKATASSSVTYAGGIAGNLTNGTISNCYVKNTSIETLKADCFTGAILGNYDPTKATLSNNYYTYDVTVTNSSGSATGYTKRGYWTGSTWDDITTNDGAMLYVKPATITVTSTIGSTATFDKTTVGSDCYDINGSTYYYAVGQNIGLNINAQTTTNDGRTFSDELTALTMNDGTNNTDIKTAKSFTMPDADAAVTATFTQSSWFTIASNGKKWMTFYHDWKDASNAAVNYTVTDGTGATTPKTITVNTITAIDATTGGMTKKDLDGVSFSGVPTLFNCDGNLPAVLKFEPVDGKTAPTDVATQFKGVATATALSGSGIYIMNSDGGFDHAYITTSANTLAAHRCYIDLGSAAGAARLYFVEEAVTGVNDHELIELNGSIDCEWYTLDGRKLDKLPTKKGLYIYKGKLTVIK